MELRFPLLLDGATGTELYKKGFFEGCAEQWVLEHPDAIIEVQKAYVAAGSNIVYAATFGANRVKLESHGLFDKVEEYNLRLVELSRRATAGKALVAGDMAPTGLFLAPLGETSFEELVEIYTEQAAALEKAGVDLFVIETMMSLPEARAALLAVKSVSRKPVFVTFTCDENGRTLTGTDVTAALLVMQGMGAAAFGLNCSTGPKEMLEQILRLRPYAKIPLIAKPNAGLPQIVDGKTVYDCPPLEFASLSADLANAGVAVFGGCCGTTPAHIQALQTAVADLSPAAPAPQNTGMLCCASEKSPCFLEPDVSLGEPLRCDDSFEETLEKAMESDAAVLTVVIEDETQLETFADCQYAIDRALCFAGEDAVLLEQALRLYQGRAMYEGGLSDELLWPLCKKYGLII